MHSDADITLALLAGGAGTRMGMPKAWLRVNDKPILEFLADRFAWPGPTLLVTAPGREHPPGSKRFDREVTDSVADEGPLRGVLTALEHLRTPLLVVATVDMPNLLSAHLRYVAESLRSGDAVGLMVGRPDGGESRVEPFPSAFRKAAAPAIAEAIADRCRSVHGLLRLPGFASVGAPSDWGDDVWVNLNVPADLDAWSRPHS